MKYKIILASNSPRRCELLAGLDLEFEVRVIDGIDESYPNNLPVEDIPVYISEKKAAAYEVGEGEIVLTADTVVVLGNEVLGELSGKTHQVITGVCMKTTNRHQSFAVTTDVTFKQLSEEEIDYYVSHYKPFDKAGAYGIQEWIGYIGVTALNGSYFNVMGLPVQRIYEVLKVF